MIPTNSSGAMIRPRSPFACRKNVMVAACSGVAFASTFMLDDEKYTLAVGLQSFISEHDAQWNYMAATAVLIAIPVSIVFYGVQKNLVTGLTAGGTKG